MTQPTTVVDFRNEEEAEVHATDVLGAGPPRVYLFPLPPDGNRLLRCKVRLIMYPFTDTVCVELWYAGGWLTDISLCLYQCVRDNLADTEFFVSPGKREEFLVQSGIAMPTGHFSIQREPVYRLCDAFLQDSDNFVDDRGEEQDENPLYK